MAFEDMFAEFGDLAETADWRSVEKTLVDGETKEESDPESFIGVFYPMKAQQVAIKPEGQRSWRWLTCVSEKDMKVDDIVVKDELRYRIMGKKAFQMARFFEYDLAEGFDE